MRCESKCFPRGRAEVDGRMTREQAVRWCQERGYGFVELDRGEIVYTHKGGIKRERID